MYSVISTTTVVLHCMYCDSKNATIGGEQNQHMSVYSGLGTESSNLKFTMSCNELQYVLITSINGRSK